MFDKVSWTSQNKSSVHTHINNFVNAKLDIAQESLFSKRMFLEIENLKKKKNIFY